ncbi:MAG: M15 family metallopeptidase [Coriobacteriales bacterium]|jgi:D-alanyl-D-alanine carboxypeptidase|nr:M15 family metallopeptidase [Coriobacteriales bacterium]
MSAYQSKHARSLVAAKRQGGKTYTEQSHPLDQKAVPHRRRTSAKRGHRRGIATLLVCLVLLIAVAGGLLWYGHGQVAKSVPSIPSAAQSAPVTTILPAAVPAAVTADQVPYARYYYYDASRAKRYVAYAAKHPKLDPSAVVWQVDVDLDYDVFTHVESVRDPDSDTPLINKHFKLAKDFVPKHLVSLDSAQVRSNVAAAFEQLAAAASGKGLSLTATSGYRSYAYQEGVFDNNAAKYGKANAYVAVAVPGFSEHQSGLAIDVNGLLRGEDSETSGVGGWLHQNAWKYGFIVRYTKANRALTQYTYEPWHIRYVGKAAAKTMHDQKISTFEEYWVKYVEYQAPA